MQQSPVGRGRTTLYRCLATLPSALGDAVRQHRLPHNPASPPDYTPGRYEIYGVDNGDVLLTAALQSRIWRMPVRTPVAEVEPAEVSDPAASVVEDLGQPAFHVRTGALVGYLKPGKPIPIDQNE